MTASRWPFVALTVLIGAALLVPLFASASGARHEGEWRQGKRHGPGVAMTADGTETAGQWTDDRAVE